MKELRIEIGPDGKVSIQVVGVAGPDCLEETRELEEALGKVISREKTDEYYQTETTVENQTELEQYGS